MELEEIIKQIDLLNDRGIELTKLPRTYDKALEKHKEAEKIAREAIDQEMALNPDYLSVSLVNQAWVHRRRDADRILSLDLIDEALDFSENTDTYFGNARALEEKALVLRYLPRENNRLEDLELGLRKIEESMHSYQKALENPSIEIVRGSKEEKIKSINDRLYRSAGIASTLALEIVPLLSSKDERVTMVQRGVDYAKKEVNVRQKDGDVISQNMMNAYHTLGVALTQAIKIQIEDEGLSVEELRDTYYEAERNLSLAKRLVSSPVTNTVLDYRFAALEHAYNPENTDLIRHDLDKVLRNLHRLDAGIRAVLKEDLYDIGRCLGADYISKIDASFSAIPK